MRSWWQEKEHVLRRKGQEDKRFTITAVPLMVSGYRDQFDRQADPQHWSARSPKDTNATLWSGFHVKSNPTDASPPRTFMHLGDTGSAAIQFFEAQADKQVLPNPLRGGRAGSWPRRPGGHPDRIIRTALAYALAAHRSRGSSSHGDSDGHQEERGRALGNVAHERRGL